MHAWPLWVSWWAIWSTRSAKDYSSLYVYANWLFHGFHNVSAASRAEFWWPSKSWRVILQFAFCGGLALPFKALPSLHCRNLKCWHGCGHRALRYSQAELFSLEVLRIWLLAHLRQCLSICEWQSMVLAPVSKSIRCTWDFQAVGSAIFVYWLFGV